MEQLVWVPAIPLPFFGMLRHRCRCGAKFRHIEDYERHFVAKHVHYPGDQTVMAQLPVSAAIVLGYGPWLMQRARDAARSA